MKKFLFTTLFIIILSLSFNKNVYAQDSNFDYKSIFGFTPPVTGKDISVTFRNYTNGTIRTATLHGSSSINFYPVLCTLDDGIQCLYYIGITSSENPQISLKYDNGHTNVTINSINELSKNNPIINTDLDVGLIKLNDITFNENVFHIYSFIPMADNNIMPYEDDTLIYTTLDSFLYMDFRKYDVYTAAQDVNVVNDLMQLILQGKYGTVSCNSEGKLEDVKQILYDLEVPQNLQASVPKKYFGLIGDNVNELTLKWNQSDDVDLTGWNTEVFVKVKGKYGKYQWSVFSSPHSCETSYKQLPSVSTYKLKIKYNMFKELDDFFKSECKKDASSKYKWVPTSFMQERYTFLVRNEYYDETSKIQHYSNYVRLEGDKDGNYSATEIDGQKLDDLINSDSAGMDDNKIEDSVKLDGDYVNDDISGSKDGSFGGGVNTMKGLFQDLKGFPSFFNEVLGFMPDYVFAILGAFIVVACAIAIIKLVI